MTVMRGHRSNERELSKNEQADVARKREGGKGKGRRGDHEGGWRVNEQMKISVFDRGVVEVPFLAKQHDPCE